MGGSRKFRQGVTEGAFPVNWIIDKGLARREDIMISYDGAAMAPSDIIQNGGKTA